jgi:hypothetical protein
MEMALLLRQDAVGLIRVLCQRHGKKSLRNDFLPRPQGKKNLILTARLYT